MQRIALIPLLWLVSTAVGYLLPIPSGDHNITLTTGPLIDYTRNQPHVSTQEPRELMLSVFQPAKCGATIPIPYMPNKTAEFQGPFLSAVFGIPFDLSSLFLDARLPVCTDRSGSCWSENEHPILLLSPAYTIPRLYYSVLASAIASKGFTVITIDHPGDANIITYPDGHTVYNNDTVQANDTLKAQVPSRIADISFVIDQLSNATAMGQLLPKRGPRPFRTDRVAVFGHSLGGNSAVAAAAQDSRIRGVINWDGTFFQAPPASGLSQPVMLIGHGVADDTWAQAYPLLHGPKLWMNVTNTTHETFTDVPTLVQAAGLNSVSFADLLGTIAPVEMVKILMVYTTAWMHGALEGREGGPLLEGKEPSRFPEVNTVMRDNF